jgi:hypothetical protein
MNRARLLACPSCARHVRATERACPFCATSLPETFAAAPAPRAPTKRLSRAALYAFGATSITVSSASSSSRGTPAGDTDGSTADASPDSPSAMPLYGAAAPDGGFDDDAEPDQFGASPPVEAGEPGDGESPPEAGEPDGGSEFDGRAVAAYGAPGLPFDSGKH